MASGRGYHWRHRCMLHLWDVAYNLFSVCKISGAYHYLHVYAWHTKFVYLTFAVYLLLGYSLYTCIIYTIEEDRKVDDGFMTQIEPIATQVPIPGNYEWLYSELVYPRMCVLFAHVCSLITTHRQWLHWFIVLMELRESSLTWLLLTMICYHTTSVIVPGNSDSYYYTCRCHSL